jgi:hypothetical protein
MIERRVNHELRQQNAALDMLEADTATRNFYRNLIRLFCENEVPFLVGGTFALQRYTGVTRRTKDIDFFIRREDFEQIRTIVRAAGLRIELTFPHWLGKVFKGYNFADLAFRSGNGEGEVDDEWFEHSTEEQLWGLPVRLCPPEETIWSKSFIMERERFDGADIVHIIHSCAEQLDWDRLVRRFGSKWRVLLIHLLMFGFVYPSERTRIPERIMRQLLERTSEELDNDEAVSGEPLCRGTLLSREQYLQDVHEWGYSDARIQPLGNMTAEEVDHWTAAIDSGR